jgi:hypothetical protein
MNELGMRQKEQLGGRVVRDTVFEGGEKYTAMKVPR